MEIQVLGSLEAAVVVAEGEEYEPYFWPRRKPELVSDVLLPSTLLRG